MSQISELQDKEELYIPDAIMDGIFFSYIG